MDPALQTALSQGPLVAAELRRRLGISQPSLSRLLARERRDVAVLGRGRASRYGLYRRVRELDAEIPVHRVSRGGTAERIGTLLTLAPDRFWFVDLERPRAGGEHRSLPWFITDMRPQGFLGRLFPANHRDPGLPERIADWNEDQTLYALARRGEDCVGNLVVGAESLAALDDELVGERRGWPDSAAALLRAGRIDAADARELRFLAAFGELIANTDMHLGNVSFTLGDDRRLRLAPAYDMLPMAYAPAGEGWSRRAAYRGEPRSAFTDQWLTAVPVARAYWARVAGDQRISRGFRRIAAEQSRRL